ncbi:MAG TPA: hypothetical protein VLG67_04095 [Candidatus Saccharimonadales bacterium]|nr:hypothetical protein [Candidatus Saccharimonadales bacterium]
MDNQTSPASGPQPSTSEVVNPVATPPTEKPKPYGRNLKRWILIYLAIGAVIYAGVYYFVLAKQSTKPYSAPVTKTLTTPTPPLSDNIKTYTDQKLGITFKYLKKDPNVVAFPIAENKVCITYDKTDSDCSKGQYVEVFTKTADQTLKEAIEKQFLKGIDPKDCYVINITREYNKNAPTNLEYDMITFPKTNDSNDPFSQSTAIKCPEKYREKNGVIYFMADKNFPTRFAFFSIGQYAIMAGKNTVWQATFKFTEPNETVGVLPAELQSFPVYTNAKFVKKEVVPPCKGEASGYSICDQTLYIWSSPDDGDIIQNWYQNSAESGWDCGQGGAGEYTSSRNFYRNSTCIFRNKTYGFILEATQKETKITLSVKNTYTSQADSSEGQSCGRLAGPAGNAKCQSGLVCKYMDPSNPNEIGTCVRQ